MTTVRYHWCEGHGPYPSYMTAKFTLSSDEPIRWVCTNCDYRETNPRHPDYEREATFLRLMADVDV